MELNKIKQNLRREQEGIWVTYPDSDIKLRIARTGTVEYDKMMRKLIKKYRMNSPSNRSYSDLSSREQLEILAPAVAKYVLVDWRNITVDGKELKYSVEKACELLTEPEYENFSTFVLSVAGNSAAYLDEYQDDIVKN